MISEPSQGEECVEERGQEWGWETDCVEGADRVDKSTESGGS